MPTRRVSIPVLLACLAGGCATYHPMPLTDASVERALTVPSESVLRQEAANLHHPILRSIELSPGEGLSPEGAAVLSVLISPSLRAQRDQIGVSAAQLITAGLLPNPTLNGSADFVTSGPGVTNPYGVGVSWDVTSLITHDAKVRAARESLASVRLDVAWAEWQTAEAAKAAVYDLVAIQEQLARAEDIDRRLQENLTTLQRAVDQHQRTVLELATARAASETSHATVLSLRQQLAHQQLSLRRALGVGPEAKLILKRNIALPTQLALPPEQALLAGLQSSRLDLQALRRGYESQEQNVRAAILQQFPKINLGFNRAKDNTGVYTVGLAATIELPIFDRNQGGIALERATRQRLFDEYTSRISQGRSDVAMAMADIEWVTREIEAARAALPALRRLVDVYRMAVEQRNADVLSYYTAWNDLEQKGIDLIKLQQALVSNWIALELATGRELPQAPRPTTMETRP